MSRLILSECVFYIPRRRDSDLSDGELHSVDEWEWLDDALYASFAGLTISPGWFKGFWRDPETGERTADVSAEYKVAVAPRQIRVLRRILAEACRRFEQKAIYLSVRGKVEFIKAEP